MNTAQHRKSNSATAHAVCAIVFLCFTFIYLHFFQADILAYTQHVLSHGATHYSAPVGTVVITFTLYLLHLLVYGLTRLRRGRHALTYVPSLLLLAVITSGGARIEEGFQLGVWTWLLPLMLAVWGMAVWVAMKIPYGPPQHSPLPRMLMLNLATMCAMMLFVGFTANTDSVFHYRVKTESLLLQGRYDEAASVGNRSAETDSCLTMLRAYALARQGLLGEKLFTYPLVGSSATLLPTDSGSHCVMYPTDSIYRFLGAVPVHSMTAHNYLNALQRQGKAGSSVKDYVLCGLLLDRDLDGFVRELTRHYTVNDSLPRHYREALTLYTHSRSNPAVVYHNDVMDTDFADLQTLERQHPQESDRRLAVFEQYRTTYWWYYEY